MKHAMTLRLLVAGVCALGTAAYAQQGSGSGSNSSGSNSTYGSGSEMSAPNKNLTRSQKKEGLERVKKAILDASLGAGQESGSSGGAMAGSNKSGGVKHLKVMRRGEKIVIRGTVNSQDQKDRLGTVANQAAQGEQIVNELKVK